MKKEKGEKKKESEESSSDKEKSRENEREEGKPERREEEVIYHNYKTRRNKSNYNEDVISKVRITEERKAVRVAVKDKNAMLTY
jgi:hypothetical protein